MPWSCTSRSLSAAIPDADVERGARRTQRVVLVRDGIPNAAMTASPAYFSTVPPWRVIAAETVSK